MSEKGWRAFLAAGLPDWVVLHGGAVALFRVSSLVESSDLAAGLARIPGLEGSGAIFTTSEKSLSIRLSRDIWMLEEHHIELARAISMAASDHGAVADRSAVQEVQLAIAAKREDVDIDFWRAVLGYAPMAEDNAVDPLGHSSTVWMQEISDGKALRHAMHIDVSVAREHAEARLTAAIAAGGRIVADESPSHWTLSDRAGNRVCICAWPDRSDE